MKIEIGDQEMVNQKTTLHGMPALLTQHILINHVRRGGKKVPQTTYAKSLRFVNGNNYYILSSYISTTKPLDPEDMPTLDKAWETLSDSLVP